MITVMVTVVGLGASMQCLHIRTVCDLAYPHSYDPTGRPCL